MRRLVALTLAVAALFIFDGCGSHQPKLPEGTPTDADGAPILKIEPGKRYYVSDAEDREYQRTMTKAIVEAINAEPDEMEADKLDFFVKKLSRKCITEIEYEGKMPNGLKIHFRGRGNPKTNGCAYYRLAPKQFVCTYSYLYNPPLFGNPLAKTYGHRYHARAISDTDFEITGFESRKEAVDLYLHLLEASTGYANNLWDYTEEHYGRAYYVPVVFGALLFDFYPDILEEEKRLVLKTRILENSMKRPLEHLIEQLGGVVVESPDQADIVVSVKTLGMPESHDLEQLSEAIEDGEIDVRMNAFQSEISLTNLGATLAHGGHTNMGYAAAGLGVLSLFSGGDGRFAVYAVQVIDAEKKRPLWSRVIKVGGKYGYAVRTNDDIYLQLFAYHAASELVGRSVRKKKS